MALIIDFIFKRVNTVIITAMLAPIGVGDGSVVEPAPQDTQVFRGRRFKSYGVLLLGPRAIGVLRPA